VSTGVRITTTKVITVRLNKGELVSCLIRVFGRELRLDNIDLEGDQDEVRFTLQGERFRVTVDGRVDGVERSCLVYGLKEQLMTMLLKPVIAIAEAMKLAA